MLPQGISPSRVTQDVPPPGRCSQPQAFQQSETAGVSKAKFFRVALSLCLIRKGVGVGEDNSSL